MTERLVAEDALLGGAVRLLQPAKGHRAGTDAVLLAAAASPEPGAHIVDAGAGTGAVGLMILTRSPSARLTLVERDAGLAELCRRNLDLNGRDGHVAAADLLDPRSRRAAGLEPESADWVVTNPPFLEEGRARMSPDASRAAAHALPPGGLDAWLRACAAVLKPKGRLALIHRADRIGDCLAAFGPGFGAVCLRLVHPRADQPANRLLLTATKGSRAPPIIAPPLILHNESGGFTAEADALHRGGAFPP